MNAPCSFTDATEVEMDAAGQVAIPEEFRRAVGFAPGRTLVLARNDRGEVVLMTKTQAKRAGESLEERRARILAAIDAVAGTVTTGFASTDEYMDYIRPWRNDPL